MYANLRKHNERISGLCIMFYIVFCGLTVVLAEQKLITYVYAVGNHSNVNV